MRHELSECVWLYGSVKLLSSVIVHLWSYSQSSLHVLGNQIDRTINLLQTTNYSTKFSLSMSVCLWNHCDQSDLTSLGFVSPEQKDRAALQIIKTNWTKLTWPVTSSSLDVLGKKTDGRTTVARRSVGLPAIYDAIQAAYTVFCILVLCRLQC